MFSLYVLIYEIFAILISMVKYNSRKQEHFVTFILVIIFSMLMAFRVEEIPDTAWYTAVFENTRTDYNYGFSLINHYATYDAEYGFVWLIVFFKKFVSQNVHFFYFFIACMSSLFFLLANHVGIKYINEVSTKKVDLNFPVLFCIYSSYYGLYYCGIAIRSALAIPMILLAVICFIKKKFISGLVCCLMGMAMHRLVVIMLVDILIVFIPKIKKKLVLSIWFVMGIGVILKISNYLNPITIHIMKYLTGRIPSLMYGQYISDQRITSIPKAFIWLWIIGLFLIVFCYDYKRMYRYIYIFCAGFIIIFFAGNMNGISRVYDMYTVSYIPVLHEYYNNNLGIQGLKRVFTFAIVLINVILVLNIYGWV